MLRPDPARPISRVELSALSDRILARLEHITFCKDDALSIQSALQEVRQAIEGELWSHRENPAAVRISRQIWEELSDTLLAYRYRASITEQECYELMQWRPAFWLSNDLEQWRQLGSLRLALCCAGRA